MAACAAASAVHAADSDRCAKLAGQVTNAGAMDSRQVNQALFKAADRDCAALADQLLQHGASAHARDGLGRTALIHAARAGSTATARLLLERGAPVDQPSLNGSTALFVAAEADKADIAEMLLAANANVNSLGRSGLSPLAAAAFNADDQVALLLLERGADAHGRRRDRQDADPLRRGARPGRARRAPARPRASIRTSATGTSSPP